MIGSTSIMAPPRIMDAGTRDGHQGAREKPFGEREEKGEEVFLGGEGPTRHHHADVAEAADGVREIIRYPMLPRSRVSAMRRSKRVVCTTT